MRFAERALAFDCAGDRLVGVLAEPVRPASVGLVIVVGGPQYRVGSHRQFVLLARRLAGEGIAVLRFDCRGMGDGTGTTRSFEDIAPDVGVAIDALRGACPSVERIVLWGLCDAASAAALYLRATRDDRVAGLTLLNPWVRSEVTIARTQLKHYYVRRFLEKEFWSKLLCGGVSVASAARAIAANVVTARDRAGNDAASIATDFRDRMAEGLLAFAGPVLIVLSERDLTAKEFVEYATSDRRWRSLLEHPNVERHDIAEADHTFSTAAARASVENVTLDWLRRTLVAEHE